MTSTRKKKDIQFGKQNLLAEDEFNPEYGKERITLFVDQQVVDAFREKALAEGKKYQAMMRESLREYVFGREEHDLLKRLEKIESIVLKKQA